MSDRRAVILDAALGVLAGQGMRGLTHRAVDAAADLPAGSTSYYFRSRSALVTGCVDRLLTLDAEREIPDLAAVPPGRLVDALADVAVAMATTERTRTLARYELTLAATRDPDLRAALVAGGDAVRRLGAGVLAAAAVPDPEGTAADLAAVLDGMVLTALLRGPEDADALAAAVRTVVGRLLRGGDERGRG